MSLFIILMDQIIFCATQVKFHILTKELSMALLRRVNSRMGKIFLETILPNLETLRVFAYQIKGYLKVVNNIKDYYDLNMDMLDFDNLKDVFYLERI